MRGNRHPYGQQDKEEGFKQNQHLMNEEGGVAWSLLRSALRLRFFVFSPERSFVSHHN